jgi:hypothetical protein
MGPEVKINHVTLNMNVHVSCTLILKPLLHGAAHIISLFFSWRLRAVTLGACILLAEVASTILCGSE